MNLAGSFAHSGVTVHVEGLNEVFARLRKAGNDFGEMRDLHHRLGNIVITNARPPVQSGEVLGTLRSGRGKTKAVVRAGYAARARYAGVLHYGDPYRGHRSQPFLTDALRRSQSQVISEYMRGIDLILHKNNLI